MRAYTCHMTIQKILTVLSSFIVFFPGIAQIYSPDPHYSDTVQYSPCKDSVFVFNEPDYGDRISITLAVDSPDSTDGWAFIWSKYDTSLLDYTPFLATAGMTSGIDTMTTFAGIRVIRSKGTITDTSQVWVIFHDYRAEIISKDTDGVIPAEYTTCNTTIINSIEPNYTYHYFVPGHDSVISFSTTYHMSWEKDTEEGSLPTIRYNMARVVNPPYENTTYVQKLKDARFGLERSDTVFYIAVRSKAELDTIPILLSDKNYYPEKYGKYYGEEYHQSIKPEYSSPAKILFFDNASKNAARFHLEFGDGNDTTFYNNNDTILHEYYYPGTYQAKFFTFSPKPQECIDSVIIDIVIANPFDSLVFPDVFTPNCDGDNDYFRTHDVSINSISIAIFNRYGRKVHEFSGNIRDWEGWNGRIMDSKRRATEGIYYYIVEAIVAFEYIEEEGIKIKQYGKEQKSGFVYLFIGDNDACD